MIACGEALDYNCHYCLFIIHEIIENKDSTSQVHLTWVSSKSELENSNIVYDNCMKILTQESSDETAKWMIDNKFSGANIRNERSLVISSLTKHIFEVMLVEGEKNEYFLNRVVLYYKSSPQKAYEFCRFLKFLKERDSEFEFIYSVAVCQNTEPISFYVKVRKEVIDSFLNKNKK